METLQKLTKGFWQIRGFRYWVDDFGHLLVNVHKESACAGQNCPLHNPSDHKMKDFPQLWRDDWGGFMERMCPCGVGHPDPDCIRAQKLGGGHGCCGCCQ